MATLNWNSVELNNLIIEENWIRHIVEPRLVVQQIGFPVVIVILMAII